MAGRPTGLDALSGDGVPVLAERLRMARKAPATERMLRVAKVLFRPAPSARRSRHALTPD
jgi:hypothetical protein